MGPITDYGKSIMTSLMNGIRDMVLIVDSGSILLFCHNPRDGFIFQIPPDSLNKPLNTVLHDSIVDNVEELINAAFSTNTPQSDIIEKTIFAEQIVIECTAIPSDDGLCTVTMRDRSYEAHYTSAFKDVSRDKFKIIAEFAPVSILITDFDGHILFANKKARLLLKLPEDLTRAKAQEMYLDIKNRIIFLDELKTTGVISEKQIEFMAKDGRIFTALMSGCLLGREVNRGIIVAIQDISDIIDADAARKDAEILSQTLINAAPDAIVLIAPDGLIRFASPVAYKICGIPPGTDVTRLHYSQFVTAEGVAAIAEIYQTAREHAVSVVREIDHIKADGTVFPTEINLTPLLDSDGKYIGALSIIRDITSRKIAEKQLLESESKYRFITENIIDVVWQMDRDLNFTYVNKSEEAMTGYTVDDLIGKNLFAFITPEAVEEVQSRLASIDVYEECQIGEFTIQHACKDGSLCWVEVITKPIFDANGKHIGFQGVKRNINDRKLAEDAFRESENRFRQIAENVNEIFWLRSNDKVLYISPIYEQIWERPRDELYDNPALFGNYIVEEDREKMKTIYYNDFRNNGVFDQEFRIFTPSGAIKWVRTKSWVVAGTEGENLRTAGIAEDITQRKLAEKQLQESRERLEMAIFGADIGIWDWNIPADEITLNDRWATMLGYEPYPCISALTVWKELLHPDDELHVAETLRHYITGVSGKYEIEYRLKSCDGSYSWVLNRGKIIERDPDGKPIRMAGTQIDITRLKKLESELITQKEKAESANRAKSVFLSKISHELRTPLNAIVGFGRLLNDLGLPQKAASYTDSIVSASDHLMSLITDILDFSRIEAGAITLANETFNLYEILTDIDSLLAHKAKEKGLVLKTTFHGSKYICVKSDRLRLRQVLVNFVGNSIKFTSRGTISVTCAIEDTGDSHAPVTFTVSDTGIGIPDNLIEGLFQPFAQLHDSNGGTGLGLSISREIVEAMGGSISAGNNDYGGAVFSFTVNLEIAASIMNDSSKDDSFESFTLANGSPRLLIVEDNQTNQMVITEMLDRIGITDCDIAHNGAIAIEKAMSGSYDLILMDCQMPVVDGFEATQSIRNWETTTGRHTPIVGLSAYAFSDDRARGLASGMDEYLIKPVLPDSLTNMIKRYIKQTPMESGNMHSAIHLHDNKPKNTHPSCENQAPGADVIDRAEFKTIYDDDMEYASEFVERVRSRIDGYVELIIQGIEAKDFDTIRAVSHKINGDAAIVAARQLRASASAVEIAARENDIEQATALFPELERQVSLFMDFTHPDHFQTWLVSSE